MSLEDNKRNTLHVAVTAEARKLLALLAKTRSEITGEKVFASDIAREAIEQYLKGLGYEVEVKVNRGGNRREKSDSAE